MQTQYNLNHAQEILEPCGVLVKHLRLEKIIEKKKGVWPAIERDLLLLPETEVLRWRPARHMQHLPGAPEVNDTPMLPNPFNARELAAFMLEGVGALVADFYGDWSDGPDPESLHCIDPDSKARRAVTEAFTAHRHAIATVGKWDEAALARRDAARKAYQNSPNDKTLLKAFDHAEAEWKATYQTWLTAMVRELLEPQAQAAPVVPVGEAPRAAPERAQAAPIPAWRVNKPQRNTGYNRPLHALLTAALMEGRPCPTARDVVEAWRIKKPLEIEQVLPDSLDYYDSKGNTKPANLAAIREAIKRMTNKR